MFLEKVKARIRCVKVVSFDIFDTLLVRPYPRPTDAFYHIELHYKRPGFRDARIDAERHARALAPNRDDITLDDIYAQMPPAFADMKQSEMDWEYTSLRVNPEMQQVWDNARAQGKKIVIASDMYLPSDFIAQILKKNNLGDYDKLYVSGEINCAKWSGKMYDRILRDFKIQPNQMLHIGDNAISDFKTPRCMGINAAQYPQMMRQFLKQNKRARHYFNECGNDLGGGILTALMAMRWNAARFDKSLDENYWTKIGYEYGGPVIYAYDRFIEQTARDQGIEQLMFIARDGYTLQRVFKTFNSSLSHSYVYAPRFLKLICLLDYDKVNINIKHPSAIVNYFSEKYPEIALLRNQMVLDTCTQYHDFIESNKKLFEKYAALEKGQYRNYLTGVAKSTDNLAIVDTIACNFSSRKVIEAALGHSCVGFYWLLMQGKTSPHHYVNYMFADNNREWFMSQTKNWNFMEFLMTAPEFPIKNVNPDGTPVYDPNPTEPEKIRKQVYPFVSDGAVAFANDVRDLFDGADIYLNAPATVSWVNCLCDYPTKRDIRQMASIKHAWDEGHTDYQPLFSVKIPVMFALRHPWRAIKMARHAIWKTPVQKIMNCISSPIKIKTHGIRYIHIILFPRMLHRWFGCELRFSNRCAYGMTVGKYE